MTIGPYYIYKCPACPQLVGRGSIQSGNYFGAIYYSDGKVKALMYDEFPIITRCPQCRSLFWMRDAEEVGFIDPYIDIFKESLNKKTEVPDEWRNAHNVKFLSATDYKEALGMARNKDEELYLRRQVWWLYNDADRNGKAAQLTEDESHYKQENMKRMLELKDGNDEHSTIVRAELYRELGEFEKCLHELSSITSSERKITIDLLKEACYHENKTVFCLNFRN